jgi:hypothetical protein
LDEGSAPKPKKREGRRVGLRVVQTDGR